MFLYSTDWEGLDEGAGFEFYFFMYGIMFLISLPWILGLFVMNLLVAKFKLKKILNNKVVFLSILLSILEFIIGLLIFHIGLYIWYELLN